MNAPATYPLSLMGKLPSCRGFVWSGGRGAPEALFQDWLGRAVARAHGVLPRPAVRFIVAPAATPMIGVWVTSQDRAGRAFPLVLLRRLPNVPSELPWTILLGLHASYLDAAESCLMLGRHESLADLERALAALELPHPSAFAGALHEARAALAEQRITAFARRNLTECARAEPSTLAVEPHGAPSPLTQHPLPYALSTLDRVRDQPAARPTLELPARAEFDLFAWLELMRARLGAAGRPQAVFWAKSARRALVDLDGPLPDVLCLLSRTQETAARRWPVWNERSIARGHARGELAAPELALIDRDATLAELLASRA